MSTSITANLKELADTLLTLSVQDLSLSRIYEFKGDQELAEYFRKKSAEHLKLHYQYFEELEELKQSQSQE
jgi:hypothetical protein